MSEYVLLNVNLGDHNVGYNKRFYVELVSFRNFNDEMDIMDYLFDTTDGNRIIHQIFMSNLTINDDDYITNNNITISQTLNSSSIDNYRNHFINYYRNNKNMFLMDLDNTWKNGSINGDNNGYMLLRLPNKFYDLTKKYGLGYDYKFVIDKNSPTNFIPNNNTHWTALTEASDITLCTIL